MDISDLCAAIPGDLDTSAAFEIRTDTQTIRVYADGRVTGIDPGEGRFLVVNRIPFLVAKAAMEARDGKAHQRGA